MGWLSPPGRQGAPFTGRRAASPAWRLLRRRERAALTGARPRLRRDGMWGSEVGPPILSVAHAANSRMPPALEPARSLRPLLGGCVTPQERCDSDSEARATERSASHFTGTHPPAPRSPPSSEQPPPHVRCHVPQAGRPPRSLPEGCSGC